MSIKLLTATKPSCFSDYTWSSPRKSLQDHPVIYQHWRLHTKPDLQFEKKHLNFQASINAYTEENHRTHKFAYVV